MGQLYHAPPHDAITERTFFSISLNSVIRKVTMELRVYNIKTGKGMAFIMLFNFEDTDRKVYLQTEGLPPDRIMPIIQELQEMLLENYEEEQEERVDTIAQMDLEPFEEEGSPVYHADQIKPEPKKEKVWKGWPHPPTPIAEQIGQETVVAMDSVTVPPITEEMVDAYAEAMKAIKPAREKLEEDRAERHEEATNEVEETVRMLHARGAKDFNYKISEDGRRVMYQCYYKCPACGDKGKRFVLKFAKTTSCHQCKKTMGIKPSIEGAEFPTVDKYGNIFVAGDWIPAKAEPAETMLDEFKFARFG